MAATLILVAACGKSSKPDIGSPTPEPDGLQTTFEGVEYTDKAVVIEESDVRSGLRGDDGTTFHFAEGTKDIDKLAPGSVVLFGGKALRKVTSVREQGGEIVVETTDATLKELISEGKIGWSSPVNWANVPKESYRTVKFGDGQTARLANVAAVQPNGGGQIVHKWTIQGIEVELKLTPKADKLEFEVQAKRASVRLTAKGWISNFTTETQLEYNRERGELLSSQVTKLRGESEITWAAVGVGSAGIDTETIRLNFPFEVPVPFTVGGIPFQLKVKAAIRIVPVLSKDSSSGGSFKITFDTDQGFASSGSLAPKGVANVRSADAQLGSTAAVTAGFIPVGFAWGWEFPRMELSLAGTGAFAFISFDTYASGEFTPGTTLTSDIPPCQKTSVRLHAIAGYKVEVLGLPAYKDQTTIWEKKTEKFKDDKPCTLTGATN